MTPKGSEVSRREHLIAAGYDEDSLIESYLPGVLHDVWRWYLDLAGTRKNNGYSSLPLDYTEIKSYFDLRGIKPEWWEIDVIKRIDYVALKIYSEKD